MLSDLECVDAGAQLGCGYALRTGAVCASSGNDCLTRAPGRRVSLFRAERAEGWTLTILMLPVTQTYSTSSLDQVSNILCNVGASSK